MLRTDDTEDDVDLRPPMPDLRLYDDRGVSGWGDSDSLFAWARVMPLLCDPCDEFVESLGLLG